MKKALIILAVCFCVFAITYLSAAFISMEPNPKNWHEEARAIYIFFSVITCFGFIGVSTGGPFK